MKLKTVTKAILTLVLFFTISGMFAQLPPDPDPDPDPVDGPLDPLPISDYILPMLVLGAATAFVLLKKKVAVKL